MRASSVGEKNHPTSRCAERHKGFEFSAHRSYNRIEDPSDTALLPGNIDELKR